MCPKLYYTLLCSEDAKQAMRKQIVEYAQKHGIRAATRTFGCSRNTVRKWLRRYKTSGSIEEQSRRPKHSPSKLDPELEEQIVEARKRTGYGPHRLSDYLWRTIGVRVSAWTIRHVLRRHNLIRRGKKRQTCYPAFWVSMINGQPFTFIQADVKYVHDKGALGTERTTHLSRLGLPAYQWTFLDAFSRMRFMAYSHELSLHAGLVFLSLCVRWVRAYGVVDESAVIEIQTDWGQEFGGDNPHNVLRLNREVLEPIGARLCRYPKGRKEYNGRVERLHRTDDEELYMPTLLKVRNEEDYLRFAYKWVAFYNLYRPHHGAEMEGRTPMEQLQHLGLNPPKTFALFPPLVLDDIPICYPTNHTINPGHDVLAKYTHQPAGHI